MSENPYEAPRLAEGRMLKAPYLPILLTVLGVTVLATILMLLWLLAVRLGLVQ